MDRLHLADSLLSSVRLSDPHRVRNDIGYLFQQYHTLRPKLGSSPKDGVTSLCIYGTLPVPYKGSMYNIPLSFWVASAYPSVPPHCVVEPTEGMIIKPRHKHVDSKGVCYLPYLAGWSPSICSLVILASELAKVFSEDPPVRAKPPGYHRDAEQESSSTRASKGDSGRPRKPKPKSSVSKHVSHTKVDRSISSPSGLAAESKGSGRSDRTTAGTLTRMIHKDVKVMLEGTSALESKVALHQEFRDISHQLNKAAAYVAQNSGRAASLNVDTHDVVTGPPKQLLELVALDAAIDDVMYQLDKGLQTRCITLDEYIVQMRRLSRDLFIARATIKKIEGLQRKK